MTSLSLRDVITDVPQFHLGNFHHRPADNPSKLFSSLMHNFAIRLGHFIEKPFFICYKRSSLTVRIGKQS